MTARRHLWVLLFALLLPFAQLAAAAHELSHVQPVQETGSKSRLSSGHCDLCALAAQIGGGAAPSSPVPPPHPGPGEAAPTLLVDSQPCAGVTSSFDSRAPPNSIALTVDSRARSSRRVGRIDALTARSSNP